MDIVRERSFMQRNKSRIWSVLILTVVLASAIAAARVMGPGTLEVERSTIVTARVEKGDFTIRVRGQGKLVPTDIQWVSSDVDGKLERLRVKPGTQVHQGDVLADLTNPDLVRANEELRWSLAALEAEQEAKRKALETVLLSQRAAVLRAKFEYSTATLHLKALEELIAKRGSGSVGAVELEKSRLENDQLEGILAIEQDKLSNLKLDHEAQVKAMAARLEQLKKSLEIKTSQVSGLTIVAGSDGVVQEVIGKPGQQVSSGESLFKVVDPSSLVAELRIPEVRASVVAIGQRAEIDLGTQQAEGVVKRIDPAVSEGTVIVDIEFDAAAVDGARPNLGIDGDIIVSDLNDVCYVKRPAISKEGMITSVYVMAQKQDKAVRRQVRFGKMSVDKIEIVEGLELGEVVILTNPTPWLTYEYIKLI